MRCRASGIGFVCLLKNKLPKPEAYSVADELKVIVHNKDDLRFAAAAAEKVNPACKLFFTARVE